LRTISYSVAAGAVQAPSWVLVAETSSTMAISISVAVSVTRTSLADIMTLARMGMVLRFSTTLCTWASALSSVARSALNFMNLSSLDRRHLSPGQPSGWPVIRGA